MIQIDIQVHKKQIRAEVVYLIERMCGMAFADTGCSDGDDLLKAGVLDSMGFLEVVLGTGKVMHTEITDEDIANPDHASVDGLCDMVLEKRQKL